MEIKIKIENENKVLKSDNYNVDKTEENYSNTLNGNKTWWQILY